MYQQSRNSRPPFRRQQRHRQAYIDPKLFVNKAIEQAVIEQPVQHEFADFLIADQIKKNIEQKGYLRPTPIQDQVIPHILAGRDVIGIANTGTGKTGAFLIPLVNKVLLNRNERVLIVAPTRELAVQIEEECRIFSRDMNIFTALIIGGASMNNQVSLLKRSPSFVIGTPGRLKDLVNQGRLNLSGFNNTVLDEVDRMLDMGFINDIKFLISRLPQKRQSLFFSATIPHQVTPVMQTFLVNPINISVKTQDTAASIQQDVIRTNGKSKIDILHDLLTQEEYKKVIVFGRTKWGMEKLSKMLLERGFRVASIHGNKSQGQRQRALDQFKKGEIQILIATDVASRGLDIDDVTHVINYDQPGSYDDYVHRIGRTGRANKKGIALTFID
jgi:ATP-dependent RNA helicase RhlE